MSGSNLTPGSSQRTVASADAVIKGPGFYNEHSRPQQKADSLGLPLLERAVGEMTVPQSGLSNPPDNPTPLPDERDGPSSGLS